MKMNIRPVFRYQARDMLLGIVPFFAVITALVAGSYILVNYVPGDVSFSGFGIASIVCLFVYGVVEPRPCMRLSAQMGVSRRTAFLGNLAAACLTAVCLALGGELLLFVAGSLGGERVYLADLYQLIYISREAGTAASLTLAQHGSSILFNALMMTLAYCGGMFFTYLFWRLNKFWTVAAALAIPLLLNLIPLLISRSPVAVRAAGAFFHWLIASGWNLMALCLLLSALLCLVCWLLVRRANIKAPSGK